MIYLLLVSIIWAFSFSVIKFYLSGIDANLIACMRIAMALPLFLPFLKIRSLPFKQIAYLLWMGGVQYGVMYLCVIRSYTYLQAYQVALFTTVTPIYVTLFSDMYQRQFKPLNLMVAILALMGAASIYYKNIQDFSIVSKGFLLVQLSDICFAYGQVAYKRFKSNYTDINDRSLYAWLFLGALIVTALGSTCTHSWIGLALISLKQWSILFYLGTVATGICFFWWNKGATKTTGGILAVFNNLKIPLGVGVAILVFKEQANGWRVILALAIVCIALLLSYLIGKKSSEYKSL